MPFGPVPSSFLKEITMTTTDPKSMKALQLRVQALALLQEAQQLDGLKPFTVTHMHAYGDSTYLLWAESVPDEAQAELVLDCEFEPELNESLIVEGHFRLEEMAGTSSTSRLPDILESLTATADSEDALSS